MAKDRKRTLTEEEAALWDGVARTATPLRPTASAPPKPDLPKPLPKNRGIAGRRSTGRGDSAAACASLTIIDRRTIRRIARGHIAIDARLDLHGMTQAEAHDRLYRFLSDVQSDGGRMILLITGKGAYGEGDRGVLRRSVPHWLASPRFRPLVAGYDQAHRSHGGTGAFYVRLKRFVR